MNAIQMKSLCERLFNVILIKITQNHYLETIFLQNRNTDFDETLHVAFVCQGEGFGTTGNSGYSPVYKKGGRCTVDQALAKFF